MKFEPQQIHIPSPTGFTYQLKRFGKVCWISNDIKWGFHSFWSLYSNSYSSGSLISHFSRVPKTLTSKMRPNAQPFL